jgi:hypothetical protein
MNPRRYRVNWGPWLGQAGASGTYVVTGRDGAGNSVLQTFADQASAQAYVNQVFAQGGTASITNTAQPVQSVPPIIPGPTVQITPGAPSVAPSVPAPVSVTAPTLSTPVVAVLVGAAALTVAALVL